MAGIPSLAMKREAPPSLPVFPQLELLRSFPTFFFARALDSVGIEGLTDRLRMLHRDAPFCRAELFVLRCLLRGRGDESHRWECCARYEASWKGIAQRNEVEGLQRRAGQLVWLGGAFVLADGVRLIVSCLTASKQNTSNEDETNRTQQPASELCRNSPRQRTALKLSHI